MYEYRKAHQKSIGSVAEKIKAQVAPPEKNIGGGGAAKITLHIMTSYHLGVARYLVPGRRGAKNIYLAPIKNSAICSFIQ